MKTLKNQLQALFEETLKKVYPEVTLPSLDIKTAQQEQFGHYQFNSAMRIGKMVNLSPRNVAEAIVSAFSPNPLVQKLEIAGPGFINITLSPQALAATIEENLQSARCGIEKSKPHERVIIDFSSPNTAKEMHVGHLRSTIIGDAIARVYEFLGHDVVRLNHVGDWGTSFGMLIAYIREEAPEVFRGESRADLTQLVTWYKASKNKFDQDADFKKRAQLQVVALQGGDPASLKAWEIICDISRKAYQEIYDILDIHLNERGESFYNPHLPEVVQELEKKGLITVSDGAKCLFLENFVNREGEPLPLMLQKSDGGYNYDTTDMAAIRHRIFEEKGTHLIYVTDAGQAQHFKMIFAAAEKASWLDSNKVKVDHVPFGLVLGNDGKKFRTREGDTEKLIDLIQEGITRARKIIQDKNPDYTKEEVEKVAHALGIGAIKYADLSTNRTGDYTFSYDKMLRFEGNTAAYLLYSYVRVNGIKRKVGLDPATLTDKIELKEPAEIALAVQILQFGEALSQVTEELLPNRLTDYLYTLAEKFHAFFRDCRVEGSPEQNSRLLLAEACARTMQKGLTLLGVPTVEKM